MNVADTESGTSSLVMAIIQRDKKTHLGKRNGKTLRRIAMKIIIIPDLILI